MLETVHIPSMYQGWEPHCQPADDLLPKIRDFTKDTCRNNMYGGGWIRNKIKQREELNCNRVFSPSSRGSLELGQPFIGVLNWDEGASSLSPPSWPRPHWICPLGQGHTLVWGSTFQAQGNSWGRIHCQPPAGKNRGSWENRNLSPEGEGGERNLRCTSPLH